MARRVRGTNVGSALDAVLRLKAKSYEYRAGMSCDGAPLPAGLQFGFLAQEVERVLPALVAEIDVSADGKRRRRGRTAYKGVNYVGMIPVLVAAIQEQQALITSMSRELHRRRRGA